MWGGLSASPIRCHCEELSDEAICSLPFSSCVSLYSFYKIIIEKSDGVVNFGKYDSLRWCLGTVIVRKLVAADFMSAEINFKRKLKLATTVK